MDRRIRVVGVFQRWLTWAIWAWIVVATVAYLWQFRPLFIALLAYL